MMERFSATPGGRDRIALYQMSRDDYLNGRLGNILYDKRIIKYASRVLGECVWGMEKTWLSPIMEIQELWDNSRSLPRIMGESLYDEIGILSLDAIINLRYKLEP